MLAVVLVANAFLQLCVFVHEVWQPDLYRHVFRRFFLCQLWQQR